MTLPRSLFYFCFTALLLSLSSCDLLSPKDDAPVGGSLEFGDEVLLTTASIGSGGGDASVVGADTLNGLTLDVMPNTFTDSRTFTISYLPIKSSTLNSRFKVITPVIRIKNGGGFAENPMTVKIPVKVPDDQFAMAFAYNAADGSLEPLPLSAQDANSVTMWSYHFEHFQEYSDDQRARSKGGNPLADLAETNLIVCMMSKAELFASNDKSEFVPGVDDWGFDNYGSMIAPGGHCAGQSFGAMYYYVVRKGMKKEPALYRHYDNNLLFPTPQIQWDDRNGYAFCSVLQANRPELNIPVEVPKSDSLTFMAFKFGFIAAPKYPQFVSIWRQSSPLTGGHAIVAYAGSGNTIRVCDPNYQGKTDRVITFAGGRFQPYNSGADAAHLGTPYPVIIYTGVTSTFNFRLAHTEWKNFQNATIGASYFTSFIIKCRDTETAAFTVATQGWKSTTGKVQFQVDYAGTRVLVDTVYGRDQRPIIGDGGWYAVPDGLNWIGLRISDAIGKWAGFKWFELEGKNGPPPSRCENTKFWQTSLGAAYVTYTDSLFETGERVIYLEDAGSPEDICSDEHIHPKWEIRGNLAEMKISAYTYWSLFGREAALTETKPGVYTGTMEIGLKQAFDNDPGYVGLQYRIKFPSRGSLATDLKYLFDRLTSAKIELSYKEHRD